MDIKYTIEILTKDIQDIEKLVGNIGNSKDASSIEVDLALSKLRNVYEVLTLIKADRIHEMISPPIMRETPEPKAQTTTRPEPVPEAKPMTEPEPVPEPQPKAQTTTRPEPVPEAKPIPESEPVTEAKPIPEPEPAPEAKPIPEPEPVPEPQPKAQAAAQPEPAPEPSTDQGTAGASILAEKFSAEASINENLAGKRGNDTEAKLMGQAIDNISRNIGINDRFLIIRELFEGEAERFTSLVNELDNAENHESAKSILKQQFSDNMDHEGVEILSGLLKRRFIR